MSFAGICECHGINLKFRYCGEQVVRPDLPQEIKTFRHVVYAIMYWSGSHELNIDFCPDCQNCMYAIKGMLGE